MFDGTPCLFFLKQGRTQNWVFCFIFKELDLEPKSIQLNYFELELEVLHKAQETPYTGTYQCWSGITPLI
jgi:hypothetical protein